jgi:hypothetical protein
MRSVLLAALVVLAACGGSAAPVSQLSPSAVQSVVDSSPTPPGKPPPNLEGLACRLPVTWALGSGQNVVNKAGFLHFPDLTLSEDPTAPSGSRFFNRASMSWLPVPREAVSPDGGRYAYAEGNPYLGSGGSLHVVNVATKADRVIYSGPTVYGVVDFAREGIYITKAAVEGPSSGLWLQNPAGGAANVINAAIESPAVGGGAAWTQDFDASDPHPAPGGMVGPSNRIERVDLKTGELVSWFYEPGVDLRVVGFDASGNPFVGAYRSAGGGALDTVELWLLTSQTGSTQLFGGAQNYLWPSQVTAIDPHGVWFDAGYTADSVWLYVPNSPIQMVARLGVGFVHVAGGCLV